MTLRPLPAAILALFLLATPACAGFLDDLVGGNPSRVPPNPFASNLPSARPAPEDARARRARRDTRNAPVPPGRIPD